MTGDTFAARGAERDRRKKRDAKRLKKLTRKRGETVSDEPQQQADNFIQQWQDLKQ